MAKPKGAAGSTVTNRPAYSRVSFLFQAAALLAGTRPATTATSATSTPTTNEKLKSAGNPTEKPDVASAQDAESPPLQGMARRLLTQMRSVSRKTNMRVRPAVKQRVCKYCDTLLVEGSTCTSVVENYSRGGKKSWADVLSVTCTTCGRTRRYPVTTPRQPRRPFRGDGAGKAEEMDVDTNAPAAKQTANNQQQGKKQDKKMIVVSRGKEQQGTKAAPTKKGQNLKQGPG